MRIQVAFFLIYSKRTEMEMGYSRPLPTIHRKGQSPVGHLRRGKGQQILLGATGSASGKPHPHHHLCTKTDMAESWRLCGTLFTPSVGPGRWLCILRWHKRFLCFLQMGRPPSWTTGSVSVTVRICQGNVSTGNRFSPPSMPQAALYMWPQPPGWEPQAQLLHVPGVRSKHRMEKLSKGHVISQSGYRP